MKKFIFVLLTALSFLVTIHAVAFADNTVSQETGVQSEVVCSPDGTLRAESFLLQDGSSAEKICYYVAVTNLSDKPCCPGGTVELKDADGKTLDSRGMVDCYRVLGSGETCMGEYVFDLADTEYTGPVYLVVAPETGFR